MRSQEKKSRRRKGTVLRALGSVNKKIYRAAQNGVIGRYMSGYQKTCEHFRNGIPHLLTKRRSARYAGKNQEIQKEILPPEAEGVVSYSSASIPETFSHRFSRKFDESKLVNVARAVRGMLLNTPMVTYGLLLFGFALFFLLSQTLILLFSAFDVPLGILSYVITEDTVLTVAYMAAAVVLMALSLILVFVQEGSLYAFMIESKLMGALLRTTMGIRQVSVNLDKYTTMQRKQAFALGVILGALTFFITPYRYFLALLIFLFAAITVNIPEFALIVGILALPYLSLFSHPTLVAFGYVALLVASTLLKLLRGKRIFRLEPLDVLVALFLLLILFGGVVTTGGKGSLATAVVLSTFGLLYFAAVVLVRDRAWLKRTQIAFMLSGIPIAILAILEFVLGKAKTTWQDVTIFSSLSGRATSLWGNPNVLAEFLLITFFVSLASFLSSKSMRTKFPAMLSALLNLSALVVTWSRGAWVALALTLVIFWLLYSHKSLPWVVMSILLFVLASVFLPDVFLSRLESIVTFSDSSTLYRIHIWQGCAEMIRDTFLTGIGVGPDAFSAVYPSYALAGIESAPHAHNLLMQILIELGIVGLVVFVLLILTVLRVAFTLFAKCSLSSSVSLHTLGLLTAIIALLIHGITEYIWYNHRIFALFFLILGLIRASLPIGMNTLSRPLSEPDACDIDLILYN